MDHHQTIIDLGCGAGVLLYFLQELSQPYHSCQVIGYDFSKEALSRATTFCRDARFVAGSILETGFRSKAFDIITSTMTMEHVDDEQFLREIARIMKPDGTLLLTTVIKKKGAWYYLKNSEGESVLEKTHLREYAGSEEVLTKLLRHGFRPLIWEEPRIRFPLLDFFLIRLSRILRRESFTALLSRKGIVKLRKMTRIPVPGYYAMEVIATRKV